MGMKITAVELADISDSDSKEELDTAMAVDNICYEKIASKLNVLHHILLFHSCKFPFLSNDTWYNLTSSAMSLIYMHYRMGCTPCL